MGGPLFGGARPWLAGHWIGRKSLDVGLSRFWIGCVIKRGDMCPLYVSELIGPGDRKSIQPTAERLALGEYDQVHHFIAAGVWDSAPVETRIRRGSPVCSHPCAPLAGQMRRPYPIRPLMVRIRGRAGNRLHDRHHATVFVRQDVAVAGISRQIGCAS